MNTLRLLICRTTTVTFGSSMNLPAVFAIWSRSSLGFRPAALMSPSNGSVMFPSGRTVTSCVMSASRQNTMLRMSSGPIT